MLTVGTQGMLVGQMTATANDAQAHLERILAEVDAAYSDSASERRKLYEQEWSQPAQSVSILGESEVYVDTVVGSVRSVMRRAADVDHGPALSSLRAASIYTRATLLDWLRTEAERFPAFARYLASVEYLRTSALVFRSNCGPTRTGESQQWASERPTW